MTDALLTTRDLRWLTNATTAATPWSAAPARFAKLLRRGLVKPVAHPNTPVVVTAAGRAALTSILQDAT